MKIKSLLLGSVAAAGLSTSAYAADLGVVLTSLDVCDSLGISGLTISSDTNCLKISGGVSYEFQWGDYDETAWSEWLRDAGTISASSADGDLDWESTVEAWLTFEGSADSSFGTALASMTIEWSDTYTAEETDNHDSDDSFNITEAYVAIGDTTVLMAGMKGSVANFDDDEPFNFLGLFGADWSDGVGEDDDDGDPMSWTGGHVIQVTSDLGNGVSVAAGLENLDGEGDDSATYDDGLFVGVLAYAGDGISAHATVLAGGVLDGTIDTWAIHAGVTAEFDMFKVRAAGYFDGETDWNVLGSAEATFDMFTLAVSGEAAEVAGGGAVEYGLGGSVSAAVTDGITLNLGGRFYDDDSGTANTEAYEVQAQIVADLTETLTATGTVGYLAENSQPQATVYFDGELAWAPGGGFDAAVGAGANSEGAYWVNFSASKDFE